MSLPTDFGRKPISCMSADARQLLNKSEAREWQEFNGARPTVNQGRERSIMSLLTKFELYLISGLSTNTRKLPIRGQETTELHAARPQNSPNCPTNNKSSLVQVMTLLMHVMPPSLRRLSVVISYKFLHRHGNHTSLLIYDIHSSVLIN